MGKSNATWALSCVIVAMITTLAHAQPEPARPESASPAHSAPRIVAGAPLEAPASYPQRTIAITTSGGSSLGAYEAGYLYYVSEILKRNPAIGTLRVSSGSSAGAINAILLALAYCSPPTDVPEDSLFHYVWTAPNLDTLYRPEDATATSIFSRHVLWEAVRKVEAAWNAGFSPSCDMLIGIPATRLRAIDVPVPGGRTTVPRSEERFSLRMRGHGVGVPASIENYVDRDAAFSVSLLPIDGRRPEDVHHLFDLAFASSAFPIAFAPVDLEHCVRTLDDPRAQVECTPEMATRALFIDGGVLENQPLRLAATLLRTGIEVGQGPHHVREQPHRDARFQPDSVLILQMDPQAYAYDGEPQALEPSYTAAVTFATALAGDLIGVARSKEVTTLLEIHPEIHDSLRVSAVYSPPIGSLLRDFFALVDRELLEFDFVLGMHDARKQVVEQTLPSFAREVRASEVHAWFPDEVASRSPTWKRFACARAVLDDVGDPADACAGDDMRSFRAALQVTIDRLYSLCAHADVAKIEPNHALCLEGHRGARPRAVPGVPQLAHWQLPHQGDPSRAMIERLGRDYDFNFHDLGLGPHDGRHALDALRAWLGHASARLVNAQPSWKQALDDVLTIALNSFSYQPRRMIGHFVFSLAPEVGVSLTRPTGRANWLRAAFAISFEGLQASVGLREIYFAVAPQVGFEIEPVPLSNARLQVRVGSRLGYAISSSDKVNRDHCSSDDTRQGRCSRLLIETHIALSFLEIFRIQLGFTFRPAIDDDEEFIWAVLPGFGVQFHSRR